MNSALTKAAMLGLTRFETAATNATATWTGAEARTVVVTLTAVEDDAATTTILAGWYIMNVAAQSAQALVAATGTSPQYAADAVMIEYLDASQDFMQVNLKIVAPDTSLDFDTAAQTLVSKYYVTASAVASADSTAMSSAAATSTTWVATAVATKWDSGNSAFPSHSAQRLMPDETDTTGYRVEVGTTAKIWYYTAAAYGSAAVAIDSSTFAAADAQSITWAGANALVASAATVMAAASLF